MEVGKDITDQNIEKKERQSVKRELKGKKERKLKGRGKFIWCPMEVNGHANKSLFLILALSLKFGCESPGSECQEENRISKVINGFQN